MSQAACAQGKREETEGSSSSGSGSNIYPYKRPIEITPGTPEGYSLFVDLDHQKLVAESKSNPTGTDVRIFFISPLGELEIDRFLDAASNWNTPVVRLWFKAQPDPDAQGSYVMYYGNKNAPAPPEDPANVFLFYDDFADTEVDPSWTLSAIGGASMEEAVEEIGHLRFGGRTGDITDVTDSFIFVHRELSGSFVVDAEIEDVSGNLGGAAKMGGLMIRQSEAADSKNVMMTVQRTPRQRLSSVRTDDAGTTSTTPLEVPEEFPQYVSVSRSGQGGAGRYSEDGLHWQVLGTPGNISFADPMRVGFPFANISGDSGFAHMAWARVRILASPEPAATLREEAKN